METLITSCTFIISLYSPLPLLFPFCGIPIVCCNAGDSAPLRTIESQLFQLPLWAQPDMCCRDGQHILFQVLLRTGEGRVRRKVLQRQTLCRPHMSFALVDHQVIFLVPGLLSFLWSYDFLYSFFKMNFIWGNIG